MLESILFKPQPTVIAMKRFMEVGNTIEIDGRNYDITHAKLTPVTGGIGYAYNSGAYILRNPYPKSLQADEDKPELNHIKTSRYEALDYLLLVNVSKVKLKVYVKVTNPDPAPDIALFVGDMAVDIRLLDTWQGLEVAFPRRALLSTVYLDVKDKSSAPDLYQIYGNIKDWEFTA